MFVKDGELYIECDFVYEQEYSQMSRRFMDGNSMTKVNLASGKYKIMKRELISANGYDLAPKVEEIFRPQNLNGKFEATENIELIYKDESGRKTVFTHTLDQHLSKEEGNTIYYSVLPGDKKIIFFVLENIGDYGHGPVYVANIDGTAQTILVSDGILLNGFYCHPNGEFYNTIGYAL